MYALRTAAAGVCRRFADRRCALVSVAAWSIGLVVAGLGAGALGGVPSLAGIDARAASSTKGELAERTRSGTEAAFDQPASWWLVGSATLSAVGPGTDRRLGSDSSLPAVAEDPAGVPTISTAGRSVVRTRESPADASWRLPKGRAPPASRV